MKNEMVLEMLMENRIDELEKILRDEIYRDNLKGNADAKKRYAAMKRYFRYCNKNNNGKAKLMPCKDIEVSGEKYNCFMDGYSIVCTMESIGEMESYDNSDNSYFKIATFFDFSGKSEKLDLNSVLASAKSKGYKYSKNEVVVSDKHDFGYAFKYRDAYYRIGFLDQAYSIINDGELAEVYYTGKKNLLYIKTSVGMCALLPFNGSEEAEKRYTMTYVDSKYTQGA